MILVGNQRGGAKDLAQHLLKDENERVQVHELRGFVADDLHGALKEAYAVSRGTRCKQFLFSLSLNPPKDAAVPNAAFEKAIEQAESKLGLAGQPRAIVFHDKHGSDGHLRRHAHVVWSRIDIGQMKAIPLSHSRRKLQDVARDLYLEHGWKMPRGLAVSGQRDPRNFTLEEWQQAKRIEADPREIKSAFQDAWAMSDSKAAFTHALQERGYWLARGDRRSFVAVDHRGEVYAIPKWVGIKTKAVRDRLGDESALPSIAETKIEIAQAMQRKLNAFETDVQERDRQQEAEVRVERAALKERQDRQRRAKLDAMRDRWRAEHAEREARLRIGLAGLWDRLRGERKRTLERNRQEAEDAKRRDAQERQKLIAEQLAKRRELIDDRTNQRTFNDATIGDLKEDAKLFRRMEAEGRDTKADDREVFKQRRRTADRPRRRKRQRDGPSLDR